jgi:hypothetical protein
MRSGDPTAAEAIPPARGEPFTAGGLYYPPLTGDY